MTKYVSKSNSLLGAGAWPRIVKIEPQIWTDENGNVEYEVIWLVTDGAVFGRSLQGEETIDSVVAHYTKRGYIDDDASFHSAILRA